MEPEAAQTSPVKKDLAAQSGDKLARDEPTHGWFELEDPQKVFEETNKIAAVTRAKDKIRQREGFYGK